MVITISGTIGSGIEEIPKLLAEKTGYRLCDNEAFSHIAVKAGFDSEAAASRYYDFDSIDGINVKGISRISSAQMKNRSSIGILTNDVIPMDIRMEHSMRGVVNSLADEGSCIILGHCANYYLKDRNDCISVFLTKDTEKRVDRIAADFNISHENAFRLIRKNDKRRGDFYAFFTSEKWMDSDNYDLFINTGCVGMEKTVSMLKCLTE